LLSEGELARARSVAMRSA